MASESVDARDRKTSKVLMNAGVPVVENLEHGPRF